MAFDPLIKTCTVSAARSANNRAVRRGTRDVLLGADNVHPTPAGSMALGQYEASAIRSILAAL